MSAVVCGKRSFFEESVASPSVSKRIRFSSSSSPPGRFSPPKLISRSSLLVDQLVERFPDMEKQFLERALEECGDDLDSTIRNLNELRLGSADENVNFAANKFDPSVEQAVQPQPQGAATTSEEVLSTVNQSGPNVFTMGGADWVELFVSEMLNASDVDDAKARAARALENLEKSICARAGAEAMQSLSQENTVLKGQVDALINENGILKRAVAIQHEQQKAYADKNQELQRLKELLAQYQEQLRTLEVNNYALNMHLKQAQQSSSIPGRFHPDIF